MSNLKEDVSYFNDQLYALVNWLTTASLALLAFFFSVLLQLKGGAGLPHPSLALASVILLVLALFLGVTHKTTYNLSLIQSRFADTTPKVRGLVDSLIKTKSMNADRREKIIQHIRNLNIFSEDQQILFETSDQDLENMKHSMDQIERSANNHSSLYKKRYVFIQVFSFLAGVFFWSLSDYLFIFLGCI